MKDGTQKAKKSGEGRRKGIYEACFKRPLDVVLSLIGLLLLWPVLLVVGILVRVKLGSPVLFRQKRPGLNGEIFELFKFRTMTDERDEKGELLPDEKRLTSFGRMLRSTSLDELPELFCILKGDLSCVGPRPLLPSYLELYNAHQARRHEVRPGLTGYAQVHGRNAVSWEERFDMDVYYVDHVTFWGDVKILFQTVGAVWKREGISAEGSATMERFTGTKPPTEDAEERTDNGKEGKE